MLQLWGKTQSQL